MKKILSHVLAFALLMSSGGALVSARTDLWDEDISAKAYILIEAGTGTVIAARNEFQMLPMASTTKIMSTLITLESGDLDLEFEADSEAIKAEGSTMGLLPGDIVTKRALCYGMMLPSGNDAANAAAVRTAGGISNFSDMMNARAAEIGMSKTSFVNPSGLPAREHYSTAYDLALLTREALKNDDFREICGSSTAKLNFGNPPYDRRLSNTNKLLSLYDGCIGVKTGFTDEAGRCLVSAAERNGVMLICITLNAPDDWNDHIKLYEKGFAAAKAEEVTVNTDDLYINVVGGDSDIVRLSLGGKPMYTVINGQPPEIKARLAVPLFIYAPVNAGDIVGAMKFYHGENLIEEVDVIVNGNVNAVINPPGKTVYDVIIDFFRKLLSPAANN